MQPHSLVKDLAINNGIGGAALATVHLANSLNPIPSTFWQTFALVALNTTMTFLFRWIREIRRRRAEEKGLEKKVDSLIQSVSQLRKEFDDSQKTRVRRRQNQRS